MKKKIHPLNSYQLFELVLERAHYPRYIWEGGDDTVYRSEAEIICNTEFWKQLIEHSGFILGLKRENPKNPHWLKYAKIYFTLLITSSGTDKFWRDILLVNRYGKRIK